jgi:hypothetical protein
VEDTKVKWERKFCAGSVSGIGEQAYQAPSKRKKEVMKKYLVILVALCIFLPAAASADPISVDSSYWTGSRSSATGSGLTAYDGWREGAFSIGWAISNSRSIFEPA